MSVADYRGHGTIDLFAALNVADSTLARMGVTRGIVDGGGDDSPSHGRVGIYDRDDDAR